MSEQKMPFYYEPHGKFYMPEIEQMRSCLRLCFGASLYQRLNDTLAVTDLHPTKTKSSTS